MSPELLADLADLFAVEALEAHSNGDVPEATRLLKISEKLFEEVLGIPPATPPPVLFHDRSPR